MSCNFVRPSADSNCSSGMFDCVVTDDVRVFRGIEQFRDNRRKDGPFSSSFFEIARELIVIQQHSLVQTERRRNTFSASSPCNDLQSFASSILAPHLFV